MSELHDAMEVEIRACGARLRRYARRGKTPPDELIRERDAAVAALRAYDKALRLRRPPEHGTVRAVITPKGRFASMTAAAAAFGISRQAVWKRIDRGAADWRLA